MTCKQRSSKGEESVEKVRHARKMWVANYSHVYTV